MADSNRHRMAMTAAAAGSAASDYPPGAKASARVLLYRVGAWLVSVRGELVSVGGAHDAVVRAGHAPRLSPSRATVSPGPEIRAALEGRYGAATRPTAGQRSLTLNSAVPSGTATASSAPCWFRSRRSASCRRSTTCACESSRSSSRRCWRRPSSAPRVRDDRQADGASAAEALALRAAQPAAGRFASVDRRTRSATSRAPLEELTRRLDEHIQRSSRSPATCHTSSRIRWRRFEPPRKWRRRRNRRIDSAFSAC